MLEFVRFFYVNVFVTGTEVKIQLDTETLPVSTCQASHKHSNIFFEHWVNQCVDIDNTVNKIVEMLVFVSINESYSFWSHFIYYEDGHLCTFYFG